MAKSDAFPNQLDLAALDVVTSLAGHNLADGTSAYVLVPRQLINQLRAELNAKYPGVVDLTYLARRRDQAKAS